MTPDYLEVAHGLGRQLVATALWHQGRCNWVGPRIGGDVHTLGQPVLAGIGPDLYGGSSGVALFLAELYRLTGDENVRRTALGAVGQALTRVEQGAGRTEPGLYKGRLGVAVAAAQVGARLQEGRLLDRAATIAEGRPTSAGVHDDSGFDLASGRAGTIVGLLILARMLREPRFVDDGVVVAEELLASTLRDDWWCPPSSTADRPLTGLSHGAAGVGFAFIQLHIATREARFLQAADLAFAYERSVFDESEQNWPDFRRRPNCRVRPSGSAFGMAWCHGAPGIALTRLDAYHQVGDEAYRGEAVAGIATTRRAASARLSDHRGNYSLCHGLAGIAEVLRHSHQIIGSWSSDDRSVAARIADQGIDRFGGPNQSWPCGITGGTSPSLMVGLAGIGHFYLRLYDGTVPSVLLFQPASFTTMDTSSKADYLAAEAKAPTTADDQ